MFQTSPEPLYVYGRISAARLLRGEGGPRFRGAASQTATNVIIIKHHKYHYFGLLWSRPEPYRSAGADSCRSLTLRIVSANNLDGKQSKGSTTLELDQSANPTNPVFKSMQDDVITRWSIPLNQSRFDLKVSSLDGSFVAFLTGGNSGAICWTPNGWLPPH
jgi:hypothetical protein